jgi:uncharacterized protein (AIM24 family)
VPESWLLALADVPVVVAELEGDCVAVLELEGDCAELELDGVWLIEESLAVVFVEELDVSSAVLSFF